MSDLENVYGVHAVEALLRHHPKRVKQLILADGRSDPRIQILRDLADEARVQSNTISRREMDEQVDGVHQGVLAKVSPSQIWGEQMLDELLDRLEVPPLLLVLDGVTDPHNLGACLRTADAAGVHAVIAPKDKAVGINATVQRVACGAADTVPYIMVTNLARTMRQLKERDVWLIGTDDQASGTFHEVDATRSIAWVMGAEGEGMRRLTRETCDELVRIPMQGSVESLNVSVASAVCLYESLRQRQNS